MRLFSTRLMAQIVKELLSVLRDPKSRTILIVPPLIQLLVFPFAGTLEVRNVDIAVYNRDEGRWSQELISRIDGAGFVKDIVMVRDARALNEMIDSGEVIAVIDIPQTFSSDIAANRPATAQLIIDGRRANAGQITQGYLSSIAATLGAELSGTPRESDAEVRNWFNPNLLYRWFITPSLAGVLVTFVALTVTSLSIARERELGTFDQLLVSPTSPSEIIVAKTLPALLIGSVLGLAMISIVMLVFGTPFTGSFLALFGSLVLFILSVVGIGLTISSVCSTQQQAILGAFAVTVPMILMSGFATPVENIPEWLRWVSEGIPLKHFLIILQGSFLKALPLPDLLANVWPLAVIAVVTLLSASLFVRSKLQ